MTVNTTNITSGPYAGNDVADTFSYDFTVQDKSQLIVYETDDTGVQTTLIVDTDYTVNNVGTDGGGTILRVAGALPTNYEWYIRSNYQPTQLTSISSQGAFLPEIHENAFDKLTFLIQQQLDTLSRGFRLSDSIDIDGVLTLSDSAATRAGLYLGFDGTGDLSVLTSPQVSSVDAIFDTVALMKIADLTPGLTATTRGYTTAGDGGGATYRIVASQVVDTFVNHTLTNTNVALLQVSGQVNARSIGMVLDGSDMTAVVNAACPVVAALGVTRLILDGPTLELTTDANFSGLSLFGNETQITGDGLPQNYTQARDCFLQGQRQGVMYNAMPETTGSSPKLVYRDTSTRYFVMTRSPSKAGRGVIFEMIRDITTLTNSLGVNAELLRAGYVYNCTAIYAYRMTATAEVGTWVDWSVPASYLGHGTDNEMQPAVARESSSVGAQISYTMTIGPDGKTNVAIIGTAGAPTCDILVDGVVVKSLDPTEWTGECRVIEIEASPGSRVIRVDRTGSGTLRVIGVNFNPIADVTPHEPVDKWSAYRDTNLPLYVQNQGAHDYAIHDADADLWGGSFHGGETVSAQEFVLDGVASAAPILSDGVLVANREVYLRQRTTIDWSGSGGGVLNTESFTRFEDGQIQMNVAFTKTSPEMNADRFYTSMHGMHEDFDRVVYPVDMAIVLDDPRTYFGNQSKVTLRHAASNSLITSDHNLYDDHVGQSGGVELNPISGSYNKLYYGPVQRGLKAITTVSSSVRKTYK